MAARVVPFSDLSSPKATSTLEYALRALRAKERLRGMSQRVTAEMQAFVVSCGGVVFERMRSPLPSQTCQPMRFSARGGVSGFAAADIATSESSKRDIFFIVGILLKIKKCTSIIIANFVPKRGEASLMKNE